MAEFIDRFKWGLYGGLGFWIAYNVLRFIAALIAPHTGATF
jgi:hypothetical protein